MCVCLCALFPLLVISFKTGWTEKCWPINYCLMVKLILFSFLCKSVQVGDQWSVTAHYRHEVHKCECKSLYHQMQRYSSDQRQFGMSGKGICWIILSISDGIVTEEILFISTLPGLYWMYYRFTCAEWFFPKRPIYLSQHKIFQFKPGQTNDPPMWWRFLFIGSFHWSAEAKCLEFVFQQAFSLSLLKNPIM